LCSNLSSGAAREDGLLVGAKLLDRDEVVLEAAVPLVAVLVQVAQGVAFHVGRAGQALRHRVRDDSHPKAVVA
jgi:hypothetical protein